MFIDVHAHLVDEKYEDSNKVVEDAKFFGVNKMICASANYETSKKACREVL